MKEPTIAARVPQHVKDTLLDIGIRDLMLAVYRGLDDGSLTWDGKSLKGNGLDTTEFERACEKVRRRPSDVLNAITEQILA